MHRIDFTKSGSDLDFPCAAATLSFVACRNGTILMATAAPSDP
jgi:hypothetical protein